MAGLGKGLSSLISGRATQGKNDKNVNVKDTIQKIDINLLQAGKYQPRKYFSDEELNSLADSIKANGVVQPILARPDGIRFEIVAGERRWRASKLAGLGEVPVIVREIDDVKALEIGIIENVQRENLNPIDEANSFQRLINEFGYTQEQLATALSKSRSRIANSLRLLNHQPEVIEMLSAGDISAGHGRALLSSKTPHETAKKIVRKQLSVRAVEDIVRAENSEVLNSIPRNAKKNEKNLESLAREVSRQTELDISIKVPNNLHQNNSGKLIINYKSLKEFDKIIKKLKS